MRLGTEWHIQHKVLGLFACTVSGFCSSLQVQGERKGVHSGHPLALQHYQNHRDFCDKLRQWSLFPAVSLRETTVSALFVLVSFLFPHLLQSQFWNIQIALRIVSVLYMIWNSLGWKEKFYVIYDTTILNLLVTLKNNNSRRNIYRQSNTRAVTSENQLQLWHVLLESFLHS